MPHADATYHRLRQSLIHGRIAPGTRLVESTWAQRLDTNRSALREAAIVLAHEGLLERGPKGGYFVPRYDLERLAQLQEVRAVLEVGALALLRDNPPAPEQLARLDAVADQMQRLIDEGYALGFVEADRRFHLLLVELGGNPHLLRVYDTAPLPLMPMLGVEGDELRAQQRQTLDDHRRLVELLGLGQYGQAQDVLRDHLSNCHRMLPL